MTIARSRSASPDTSNKKLKLDSEHGVSSRFAAGLFDASSVSRLHNSYTASTPFKYAVVDQLFDDELLKGVKDEILSHIHFTEKETDIYKVNQTGDLASLSYLSPDLLALFPLLGVLRDALYSSVFRDFLRSVTGCGPLSGSKQDMSINSYKKGCHLLNHDDVIGTRRVSYILYLPLPYGKPWDPKYGGTLELYPVVENATGTLEPVPSPSKVIPPSWNQFIFFEVQPGRSFHSVEEVVVVPGTDDTQRLSISGWFHKPQPGEEGYETEYVELEQSSLEQLQSSSATALKPYTLDSTVSPLTSLDTTFLSQFLNPAYLSMKTLEALALRFAEESSIDLVSFLSATLSAQIESYVRSRDDVDHLTTAHRAGLIPPHTSGTSDDDWQIKGPPHKLRYCVLSPSSSDGSDGDSNPLRRLQEDLFPSSAFRSWLALLSSMTPERHMIEARRFRPGLDYTLAQSEPAAPRLDVVLGLTPASKMGLEEDVWESGRCGGWECYMAPHEGEDDPAVYNSGVKRRNKGLGETAAENEADEAEDDEDEETLLVAQPGFNRLLVVLRDPGVLRFVKYVSAEAPGCRWDVCGEWEVGDSADSEEGSTGPDENE